MATVSLPPNLPDNHAAMVSRLLREATAPGFFGSIEIAFRNGKLDYARVTRAEKPALPHAAEVQHDR